MPEPHDAAATSRLDALLAARGLVKSRTAAVGLILASRVTVDGKTATKPSTPVRLDATLVVEAEDDWVSRAAHKLIAALDTFGVDPAGRVAMDVGASTGGFTQVLLARGVDRVVALDVGHGQLDPRIAIDARVVSIEGTNARNLTVDQVHAMDPEAGLIDLVVGDLSFISLRIVLPALVDAVGATDLVLLVKPQFEVGRTGVREGIVHDPGLREDSVMNVLWAAWDLGLGTFGVAASPIIGTHGNREYLVHLRPVSAVPASDDAAGEHPGTVDGLPGPNPTEWIDLVRTTTAEGS
ncbi:TlyA family RNA methyltransferase [Curtobacterium sp. Leaf261]|uniref:TlyA family RNA methyltransferase n=1 Tax=Curtobacterium sp. Leaf261 TaxID=1736311 RepID=UPI0006F3F770|nr:TlyA family RNA methyltransferase [Curtobacterium sp. Leaf261]KQO65226.1 hemolysin [Curtobacterium sp. Leaf261]